MAANSGRDAAPAAGSSSVLSRSLPIPLLTANQRGVREISERVFEPMTKAEVVAAQRAWAKYVTERDV
ncbi:MAG: hypothetical protein MI725_11950, partial [Pirellulales bacterium]|nr:hypothetical protein [Pirellulales bacterium]